MSQSAGSGLVNTASVTGRNSPACAVTCAGTGVAKTPRTTAAMQDQGLITIASLSVRPLAASDRRSPHQPTLRRRKIRARMRRAAVVPEEQAADAPDVLVAKFLLLGMVEHGVEQRAALFLRHVDEADRHQPVDVDRLAAGVLLGGEYRGGALAEPFGAFALVLSGRAVVGGSEGLSAAELVAHPGSGR